MYGNEEEKPFYKNSTVNKTKAKSKNNTFVKNLNSLLIILEN